MAKSDRIRGVISATALVTIAVGIAACGSSSSSSATGAATSGSTTAASTGAQPGKHVKQFWTYTGPPDDGGYNLQMESMMHQIAQLPNVSAPGTIYNVPYTSQISSEIKLAIAQGYNFFIDTAGLGSLLYDVCKEYPNVGCLDAADPTPQVANSRSWWATDWNFNFVAGAAAGLMTKTNVIGMVGAYNIPIIREAVNTFLLGCQSVNPKCTERVVYANTYFDPSQDSSVANTLVDAGADVLRNETDDPAFCEVAQKRNVYAVGQYYDFHNTCPSSIITSVVWDMTNYLKTQVQNFQAGKFTGSGTSPDFIPFGTQPGDPHLGTWGTFVPASVKAKVMKLVDEAASGTNLIVGPIYDRSGKLRFAAGVHPTPEYMFTNWSWYVKGVIGG
jgi:basic membrane protein A and related proteins